MCCVSLLKHRLYDTKEINSRQGMRIRSLEAQLEEVKRQSLSKLAAAEKRMQCFKNQLIRHIELHEAKHRSVAFSDTPAAATPQPAQPSPTSYKDLVFAPATPTYSSSGSRAAACDTYSSSYSSSPSYQPSTPPSTSRPLPQYLSADGTKGIGSRGGRMHLNSNHNWTYSRHQSHHVSNGPSNQPAYTAAGGLTGRGARGAAMYQTGTGSWRYESQR